MAKTDFNTLGKLFGDAQKLLNDTIESFEKEFEDATSNVELTIEEVDNLRKNILSKGINSTYLVTCIEKEFYSNTIEPFTIFVTGKNYKLSMLLFKYYMPYFNHAGRDWTDRTKFSYRLQSPKVLGRVKAKNINDATIELGINDSLKEHLMISNKEHKITDVEMLEWINKHGISDLLKSLKIKDYTAYDFEADFINDNKLSIKDKPLRVRVEEAFKKANITGHIIYKTEADLLIKDFNKYMPLIIKSCKKFDSYNGDIAKLQDFYCKSDPYDSAIYRAPIDEKSTLKNINDDFRLVKRPDVNQGYISTIRNYIYKANKQRIESTLEYDYDKYVLFMDDTFMPIESFDDEYYYHKSAVLLRDTINFKYNPKVELDDDIKWSFSCNNSWYNNFKLRQLENCSKLVYAIEKDSNHANTSNEYPDWIKTWIKYANMHVVSNSSSTTKYFKNKWDKELTSVDCKVGRLIIEKNEKGKKYNYDKDFTSYPNLDEKYGLSKIVLTYQKE